MFRRFAAGSAIASIAIALAAFAILLSPAVTLQRIYPLTIIWCFVPLVWGIWAALVPTAWVPQRFPLWGAILGLIGGSLAAFVLNLPSRILGNRVPAMFRGVGVLVMVALYYFLWMLVRVASRFLAGTTKQQQ
jgi:hypothetical protein